MDAHAYIYMCVCVSAAIATGAFIWMHMSGVVPAAWPARQSGGRGAYMNAHAYVCVCVCVCVLGTCLQHGRLASQEGEVHI